MKSIKLHSKPVYDEKYIKTKVKTFNGVANTTSGMINFLKSVHQTCITVINIDSVMKIDKTLSSCLSRRM